MTVMVGLLRGINVGGRTKVAMADLRAIAEGCGFEAVRTYIQSGNLVFRAAGSRTEPIAERLGRAIANQSAVQPEVIVRTRAQMAALVDKNPFVGEDPAHLHVVFTKGPAGPSLKNVHLAGYAPEEAAAVGQQCYLLLPSGIGRSKLATDLARGMGPTGTTRNWRTVTKLLEMADNLG